jgi:hypothetical protein
MARSSRGASGGVRVWRASTAWTVAHGRAERVLEKSQG